MCMDTNLLFQPPTQANNTRGVHVSEPRSEGVGGYHGDGLRGQEIVCGHHSVVRHVDQHVAEGHARHGDTDGQGEGPGERGGRVDNLCIL